MTTLCASTKVLCGMIVNAFMAAQVVLLVHHESFSYTHALREMPRSALDQVKFAMKQLHAQ